MRRFMNLKTGETVYVHDISYLRIVRLTNSPNFKEIFSNE